MLSNYHLAARDDRTAELLPVGKTFKGLTDREFEEMTKTLLEMKRSESGGIVFVEPQVMVEVLFSNIQKSPYYRSGMALRFARISRIRYDKDATGIDTIQTMRDIYNAQQKKNMV